MLQSIVVIGCQWGDEGKGKIVDLLTEQAAAVVRFQGGHNAGHTLVYQGKKTILRLIPSGVLHPHSLCFLGHGVVLALNTLAEEIQQLEAQGIFVRERLKISPGAVLGMPYHTALDIAREGQAHAIGTTKKGIGPANEDRVARRALRVGDLQDLKYFTKKFQENLAYYNFLLKAYYQAPVLEYETALEEVLSLRELVLPLIADVPSLLHELHQEKKKILFEGAQGSLLDLDQGTYPFVTSSHTLAPAAALGSGFSFKKLDYILGVAKAYTTRVGFGPFPTELSDEEGAKLQKLGHEFGSVTGRPRRCGWLDLVSLKRMLMLNGAEGLCLTKLDVLDSFKRIRLCTGYQSQDFNNLADCAPIYEDLPGWETETRGITRWADLPLNAQKYLKRIETLLEVPIVLVSTGPDRLETLLNTEALSDWISV